MLKCKYEHFLPITKKGARWAEEQELKNAFPRIEHGTKIAAGGLPLLSDGRHSYIDPSENHTLIYGSTGSRKSRLFIRPLLHNLMDAGESVIVNDPKGELYDTTAGYAQKQGYHVIVLNLREPKTGDRWNPLETPFRLYLKPQTREKGIEMLNDLISTLTSETAIKADPFWNETSESLLLGTALLLFEYAKNEISPSKLAPESIINMRNLLMLTNSIASDASHAMLCEIVTRLPYNSICALNLSPILGAADRTRQSIAVSLFSLIRNFFLNRSLLQMMEKSTFDISALACGEKPVALYLISPDESRKYDSLLSAFIGQSYTELVRIAQSGKNKRRFNYVLDEFANLPPIANFGSIISAARSRNIRFFLAVQNNLNAYGEEKALIKGNIGNIAYLYSKGTDLLHELSELCGNDESGDPLITVSELQHLKKDASHSEALLMLDRHHPFVSRLPDISQYTYEQLPVPPLAERKDETAQYTVRLDIMLSSKDKFKNYFREECPPPPKTK